MTHFRRYEFRKRRHCSTPAVANLHDFTDDFVEHVKSKIRLEEGEVASRGASQPVERGRLLDLRKGRQMDGIKDEEELELELNGMAIDDETRRARFEPTQNCCATSESTSKGTLTNGESRLNSAEPTSRVFKSANWISDSELIFSLTNQVGGLVRALRIFQELDIDIRHVESRRSKRRESEFEIFVDIDCSDPEKMKRLVHHLRHEVNCLTKEEFERWSRSPSLARQASLQSPLSTSISRQDLEQLAFGRGDNENSATGDDRPASGRQQAHKPLALVVQPSVDYEMLMEGMPWFPRHISELDKSANRVLMYGNELDADHPGFKDPVYRRRRKEFTEIAMSYQHGQPIPRIEYTSEEVRTWSVIFEELAKLYELHACREFLENFKLLTQYCGYRKDNIPQLEDISQFLHARTGFVIRPVAGYLSARDFLAGLAFRVFHCTQYIRHSSDPFYTPEPDCCHEMLGHCPLLADRNFAQFSQELGLASLGASDEEVDKLATCYFFTVEFGLCKEDDQLKVYGAGLLSSVAELKHAVSDSAHVIPFDPVVTCQATPIITAFQEAYFITDSFMDAKKAMREFSSTIKRPFGLRYNPYTQSVEILSNTRKIMALVSELKGDICTIRNAIKTLDDEAAGDDKRKLDDLEHLIASA